MNKKKLYDEMPCSHSVEEVRQTVQEAMEHDNDPNYWITWEEIDEEFRNRYADDLRSTCSFTRKVETW